MVMVQTNCLASNLMSLILLIGIRMRRWQCIWKIFLNSHDRQATRSKIIILVTIISVLHQAASTALGVVNIIPS